MFHPTPFEQLARLPSPGDNVAIATRRVERSTEVEHNGDSFCLSHAVLEGHRFAHAPIARGEELLSWGLPFGVATRDISPGEYVCNEKIIRALKGRNVDFALPEEHNFEDCIRQYVLMK